jgi:hypothetical protein
MCFVAMPFGKRAPTGKKKPLIDFDQIHTYIRKGAGAAGLESIRADFEPSGGFIHKPMLERLLVAEYVIADVTLSNPNVLYEIGVRHRSQRAGDSPGRRGKLPQGLDLRSSTIAGIVI